MDLVEIEIIKDFADKTANTFVCEGDNYTAYIKADCEGYMVFDHNYRSHKIPKNHARILSNKRRTNMV